jgi:hypothetical protein
MIQERERRNGIVERWNRAWLGEPGSYSVSQVRLAEYAYRSGVYQAVLATIEYLVALRRHQAMKAWISAMVEWASESVDGKTYGEWSLPPEPDFTEDERAMLAEADVESDTCWSRDCEECPLCVAEKGPVAWLVFLEKPGQRETVRIHLNREHAVSEAREHGTVEIHALHFGKAELVS